MTYQELNNPLYHGSTVKVNNIELNFSAAGKDFGRGFYTTTMRDQAVKFASIKAKRLKIKNAFVSVFQYVHNQEGNLNPPGSGRSIPEPVIKKFDKADVEWLLFVLKNRGLLKRQTINPEPLFDIVIGPVANDAVGLVLNQLLIGTYGEPTSPEALDTAIRLLNTARLYNQVFFGTGKAISRLRFQEVFEIGVN
jgi:hypothetical protein